MSLTERERRMVKGGLVVIALCVVLAVGVPVAFAASHPPGFTLPADGHYVTLRSPRALYEHEVDSSQSIASWPASIRTLAAGQVVKLTDVYASTTTLSDGLVIPRAARLYHVRLIANGALDTGANTRGYCFITAEEVDTAPPPLPATAS
jgi:hypothetical protein